MKKLITWFLMLSLLVIPASVAPAPVAEAATTKYIIKADVEYTIMPGEKITLYVKGAKKTTWSSSKKSVATVSKKGVVTGKKVGKTTITATVGKKKHKCVVYVTEYEEDIKYNRDVAARDYVDKFADATLTPDAELTFKPTPIPNEKDEAISDEERTLMRKYGFSTSDELYTDIGKAWMKFCDEWVSERELKNDYDISTNWSPFDQSIYLTDIDPRYIIIGALEKPVSGTIYTDGTIQYQYLEKFTVGDQSYAENQYFFNRADLIKAGIIK